MGILHDPDQLDFNQEEVDRFCRENGFPGVNTQRKKFLKHKYALHSAVKKQDAVMVERLLRAGARRSLANSAGQTPVELARKMHHPTKCNMTSIIALLTGQQ